MGKGHRSRDSSERSEVLSAPNLTKPFAKPSRPLSLTAHTGHMEPSGPARNVWLFLAVFLGVAWAAIIWLAVEVSNTTLAMIRYVVELAQLY